MKHQSSLCAAIFTRETWDAARGRHQTTKERTGLEAVTVGELDHLRQDIARAMASDDGERPSEPEMLGSRRAYRKGLTNGVCWIFTGGVWLVRKVWLEGVSAIGIGLVRGQWSILMHLELYWWFLSIAKLHDRLSDF